jgi:ABC transporter substrate binding protein
MCTGSGEASRAGSGPLWIWQLGGFAADPPTGSGSTSQLIMRTYPDARLRADARGRDGGVRQELEDAVIRRVEIPQRSSLMPHRGVLSFLSEAREVRTVKRREVIALIGGAAAGWSLVQRAGHAQSMPVVGFLSSASAGAFAHLVAGFRRGLQGMGFVEGQNVAVEYAWAEGRYDRLPELAQNLVRRQVSVIVTSGGDNPSLAAKAATSTIPIVFVVGGDPVKIGLVASLARPGGSATGVNIFTAELAEKRASVY